jgi:hypothetical protein
VAYKRIKTEHAGAKNGGGAWMTRAEAKETAKRKRRQIDKRAPDEEARGLSWERQTVTGEPPPDVEDAVQRSHAGP